MPDLGSGLVNDSGKRCSSLYPSINPRKFSSVKSRTGYSAATVVHSLPAPGGVGCPPVILCNSCLSGGGPPPGPACFFNPFFRDQACWPPPMSDKMSRKRVYKVPSSVASFIITGMKTAIFQSNVPNLHQVSTAIFGASCYIRSPRGLSMHRRHSFVLDMV